MKRVRNYAEEKVCWRKRERERERERANFLRGEKNVGREIYREHMTESKIQYVWKNEIYVR